MSRRKYHVGHIIQEEWVFGFFNVHQKIGVLEFVQDRTQNTLFTIIQKNVRGGTIIHSDSAAMYVNNAQQESHIINIPTIPMPPYEHMWVNHTQNFVDHITNAFTNQVESFWKRAKQKIKK